MDAVFIYCLCDPITHEIRYVGKTTDLNVRLSSHIRDKRTITHKSRWIKRLLLQNKTPEIDVLEVFRGVDIDQWPEAERWWISYLRSIGCNLTNLGLGGFGGQAMSEQTKSKLRVLATGRKHTEETRRKLSEIKSRPEYVEKARLRVKGKPRSPETIEKMRLSMIGKKASAETKAKMSLKRKGVPHTPEWTAKISSSLKARGERVRSQRLDSQATA